MADKGSAIKHYPSKAQISRWIDGIWRMARSVRCTVEERGSACAEYRPDIRHMAGGRFIRFCPHAMEPFFAYWQPSQNGPSPLLVHTPGYGAEISMHPDLVSQGYSVLAVNPLGYITDEGPQEWKKEKFGRWPVLHETIGSDGKKGYREWFANCVMAISWAMEQKETLKNRVSFFGTSQGGGASLILGSIYEGKGVRCVAADEPFLTNFPLAKRRGWAYAMVHDGIRKMKDPVKAWHTAGYIDTLSHASRLTMPVLLTAGGCDDACPVDTIESLFKQIPGTKSFTILNDARHGYTKEFIPLASAWFRLYA